ncbi:DUF6286 domain-containing protein [Leucobacter komagatae]|uniref:DNA/RNA endonuclease G n=1 Tax=Leucobacter komagatae TaxID=55969 RepID=A0A0D0H6K9_9MICO|nr:DUF6286 domain-containing protein [Leucobacter komagatae]KIP52825.1 hypothetical protein SD72_06295 [Leucobacter komagatae]
MSNAVLQRVVRRETHSPRTVITVVVLVIIIAAAAYVGTELVLRLLGAGPLLAAPGAALTWLADLPDLEPVAGVGAAGAVVALVGIVLVWFALAPGRLSKHQLGDSTHSVVVDNGVIASAVAERVRRELDLSKDGVVVGIGHRSADVTVRPEPGQVVTSDEVRAAAQDELAGYGLAPAVRVRARVQHRAETGGSK